MTQEMIDWWNERIAEQKYPSDYGGHDYWEDDGWVLATSWNPTQEKLSEVAFRLFREDLEEAEPDNVEQVRFGHWACGYVLQLNIRPIVDGELTKVGEMVYEYTTNEGFMDYYEAAYEDEEYNEWYDECMIDHVKWELKHEDFDNLKHEDYTEVAYGLMHNEPYATVESDGSVYIYNEKDFDMESYAREVLGMPKEQTVD